MIDETDIKQLLAEARYHPAFEMIVDRYQKKAFHLAWSMTRNETAAADLAQEVFLRVWKALPAYNGSASLSTWIYTITRNTCLTEIKRLSRRPTVALDDPESEHLVEGLTAVPAMESGAGMDVEAMLSRIPERYQRALRLFYLEQKSYEETAELLALPLGTLKSFLFRARKELAAQAAKTEEMIEMEAIP